MPSVSFRAGREKDFCGQCQAILKMLNLPMVILAVQFREMDIMRFYPCTMSTDVCICIFRGDRYQIVAAIVHLHWFYEHSFSWFDIRWGNPTWKIRMVSVGRVSIYKSWRLFHIHVSLQGGIFLFRLSGASHLIQVVPPPPPPPVAESGTGARRNGEVQPQGWKIWGWNRNSGFQDGFHGFLCQIFFWFSSIQLCWSMGFENPSTQDSIVRDMVKEWFIIDQIAELHGFCSADTISKWVWFKIWDPRHHICELLSMNLPWCSTRHA